MNRDRAIVYLILALPTVLVALKIAEAIGILGSGGGIRDVATAQPSPAATALRVGLIIVVAGVPFVLYYLIATR